MSKFLIILILCFLSITTVIVTSSGRTQIGSPVCHIFIDTYFNKVDNAPKQVHQFLFNSNFFHGCLDFHKPKQPFCY
jgi:hypothetical protein